MKVFLTVFFFLFACSTKQDFENDLAVPELLKDYNKEQINK